MGDEDVGEPELALQLFQQVDDLRLDGDVQRRDRFVAHQDAGTQRKGPRDPDPLTLPPGELVRITVDVVGVEPHHVQQLLNTTPMLLGRQHVGMDRKRFADDVTDRHPRVQRGVGVLEDHLDVAAHVFGLTPVQARDVLAVDLDGTRRGTFQPDQHLGERGLSGTTLTDDAESLTRMQVETHPVHGLHRTELTPEHHPLGEGVVLDQVADLQDRLRLRPRDTVIALHHREPPGSSDMRWCAPHRPRTTAVPG